MQSYPNESIKEYLDAKKARSEQGLGMLFRILGGGAIGLLTGGPLGAIAGAGSGLLGSMGVQAPAKDIQSAMDKFLQWKQGYQSPQTLMGGHRASSYGDPGAWGRSTWE